MGKGQITKNISDGLYEVKLLSDRIKIVSEIESLTSKIATIIIKIASMEEGIEKDYERLRKASLGKRRSVLQTVPNDSTIHAWCADMSDDLAGFVGTIETPQSVNIQPGFERNAEYKTDRDGQLQWPIAGTPAGTFYNLAMLPGWEKWMPTYRYATITYIDKTHDLCGIDFKPDKSTAQNLLINQADSLIGVPVDYMDCNSKAFEVGDGVIVGFDKQKWEGAKVIGFQRAPRPCYKMWEEFNIPNLCWYHLWNICHYYFGWPDYYQCQLLHGHRSGEFYGEPYEYTFSYEQSSEFNIIFDIDFSGMPTRTGNDSLFYFRANRENEGHMPHLLGGDDPIVAKFAKFKIDTQITGGIIGLEHTHMQLYFLLDFETQHVKACLLDGEWGDWNPQGENEERFDYTNHGGNPTQIRLADINITTQEIQSVGIKAHFVGWGTLRWEWDYIDFYDEEDMTIPCT